MSWQDLVLTAASIGFSYALIPQLYRSWKIKKGLVTLQTGIITCTGLFLTCIVLLNVGLFISSATAFISTLLWYAISMQTVVYGFVGNPLGAKIVLTGVGSSGKTTVLDVLKRRSCAVFGETAREVLEERRKNGKGNNTHDEVMEMEGDMYIRQAVNEKDFEMSRHNVAFFDRSVVDMWVYSLELMKDLPDCLKDKHYGSVYDEVFVFDPLPYVKDEIRVEGDEENALRIHQDIIKAYKKFGYRPIVVPRFSENKEESVRRRVNFILKTLKKKGYKI